MRQLKLAVAAALAAVALTMPAQAQQLAITDIGSFHIGGRQATLKDLPVREVMAPGVPFPLKINPNGDFEVEQMYVQFVKLAEPKAKYPLLLVHGGGMTGSTWETTPDGRPGWQMYFLRHGHDVYVADSVERGRAGFAPPQVWEAPASFASKKSTWEFARIGPPESYQSEPAKRTAYPDGKFPAAAFEQLMKMRAPSWGASNEKPAQAAYDQLVQRICPCVIIAHSVGGTLALRMAMNAPDKVKGIIVLESSGAPDPSKEDVNKVKGIPHMALWADNGLMQDPIQNRVMPVVARWIDAVKKAGGEGDWVELPKLGIKGNSHVMMMETNSDQIADVLQNWMAKNGLMK